ncbi:hypothetical protein [Candidatus Weimeria sp. HCP3S3_B5]|uniref:hypothetical protein n=1 Tax=Candidatus Weimeria sp. HCP3S3_B5 TaxID=3438871 RepID=UPI003F8AB57B
MGAFQITGYGYDPYSAYQSSLATGAGRDENTKKPVLNPGESEEIKPGKKSSPAECETCRKRKYQDGSDEGNVSFKSAAHVSPEAAGAAVRAHEGEHVANAYNKAKQGGGKVLQASVAIHTAVCPECGRVYVSGGTTTTKIAYPNETNPYQRNAASYDRARGLVGSNLDLTA